MREKLQQLHIISTEEINKSKDGDIVKVAGLVLVRQRPGTAGGICFITIEDEMGVANLVVFESFFTKYRKEILQSRLLMVEGKLQKEGEVIHVIVRSCHDLSKLLSHLTASKDTPPSLLTLSRADEKTAPAVPGYNNKTEPAQKTFPKGRNFK